MLLCSVVSNWHHSVWWRKVQNVLTNPIRLEFEIQEIGVALVYIWEFLYPVWSINVILHAYRKAGGGWKQNGIQSRQWKKQHIGSQTRGAHLNTEIEKRKFPMLTNALINQIFHLVISNTHEMYMWGSFYCFLDSLVVECWLWVREVPGSIPSQGPRHTKDVIKMVPVVPLFSTQHSKGKYWLFLKN